MISVILLIMYFLSVMQIYMEPHPRQGLLETTCKLL